jgi:REP element-mobilizing transposase RayT
MGKMIGYMVTWTTYGTWLQGDKRRYVQDGKILPANTELENVNKRLQKFNIVRLTSVQKKVVNNAILKEAERIGQKVFALAVCSNHIHLAVRRQNEPIESAVSRYKNVATAALKKTGLLKRVWTRGFDKQFCFNDAALEKRIEYVLRHNRTV